jgi:Sugar kinases, ribokinase family
VATGTRVDFLVTGEVFADLIFAGFSLPKPGAEAFAQAFSFSPGGAMNRAVAGARLGCRAAVLATIGDDPIGRAVLDIVAAEPNLDLTLLAHRPGWQTPVSAALTDGADRAFLTYYTPTTAAEIPTELPPIGVLDIGINEPVPSWARDLRAAGTRLYAGAGWDETGEWRRDKLDRLADVDAFVLNSVEACSFTRTSDPKAAARALGVYVPSVVVTCGPDGVVAYDSASDGLVHVAGVTVDAVDPTGAGDTFVAAFAASVDLDWPMADRLRLANLAAALSVTGLGGATSAPTTERLVGHLDSASASLPDPGDAGWARIHDWLSTRSSLLESEVTQ